MLVVRLTTYINPFSVAKFAALEEGVAWVVGEAGRGANSVRSLRWLVGRRHVCDLSLEKLFRRCQSLRGFGLEDVSAWMRRRGLGGGDWRGGGVRGRGIRSGSFGWV
jgi:hypothetical protein